MQEEGNTPTEQEVVEILSARTKRSTDNTPKKLKDPMGELGKIPTRNMEQKINCANEARSQETKNNKKRWGRHSKKATRENEVEKNNKFASQAQISEIIKLTLLKEREGSADGGRKFHKPQSK